MPAAAEESLDGVAMARNVPASAGLAGEAARRLHGVRAQAACLSLVFAALTGPSGRGVAVSADRGSQHLQPDDQDDR